MKRFEVTWKRRLNHNMVWLKIYAPLVAKHAKPGQFIILRTDEFGERIYYKDSPYKVADIKDEKRYLVTTNQANDEITIPAVKRGDKYLNLMDMKEFEYVAESETYKYPYFLTYFHTL